MTDSCKEWKCKAITPIWTGDADRKGNHLIPAGLLGSIRWWFEVLVRGLGGSACDPSDSHSHCPDKKGNRCSVCELFGCTGWARKFRLEIVDDQGPIQNAIIQNKEFSFQFIPLRPIRAEEWALLDLTFQIIAGYGAIGGRTVFKPSDEINRERAFHHKDYGLIEILIRPQGVKIEERDLHYYVKQSSWRRVDHGEFAWASFDNFWYVNDRYLARQGFRRSTFNNVLGRKEDKDKGQKIAVYNETNKWLAGRQQASKKVFSFKNPQRTFGFIKPDLFEIDEMEVRLSSSWPGFRAEELLRGHDLLNRLMKGSGGVP